MVPLTAMRWLWVAWVISWTLASRWSNRTEAAPSLGSELVYRVPTTVGGVFLFIGAGYQVGPGLLLWEAPRAVGWPLVGLTALGFAFCWWARIHLGRMWSYSVTRKSDHRIIDTGPYAWVRHPIYTGIIVASLAMAAYEGTIVALLGLVLIVVGCWIKARLEERFLRAQLGAEAYDAYARHTGMLFPGL
jgi:protein-S-isoprenylcysteine O-methyltransferase Ste14